MKIGVITFHRSLNYGAALQTYALQKALHSIGIDSEVIDYRNKEKEDDRKLIKNGEKFKLKTFAQIVFRLKKRKAFNKFYKENIPVSNLMYDNNNSHLIEHSYDKIIVGSDQVWNDGCIHNDDSYLLSFIATPGKRYSYAASIAGDCETAEKTVMKYKKDFDKFSVISIRESNIIDFVKSQFGDKARNDLDPVLLLDKFKWEKVLSKRNKKKPYVFMYLVGAPKNVVKFAKDLAKKENCVLIDNKTSFEFLNHNSPEEFLSWIYNAEYVVTNSFHGTAFSILFEKEFFIEYEVSKGHYNFRAKSLVTQLSIDDREITSEEYMCKQRIDYPTVLNKLDALRNESIEYLNSIKGALDE